MRLAVIGAGSMGAQIAQQAALSGIDVRIHDQSSEQLMKAIDSNRGHVMRRVEKGKLSAAGHLASRCGNPQLPEGDAPRRGARAGVLHQAVAGA